MFTGIWKEPVDGPRTVRRLNVDGDGQGDRQGHGGEQRAVFVYQLESYRYWQDQLHRDDFTFGQFGENFTVEGLGDDDVHIGDRYRIGSTLVEVTQPRVTCYRVGIRMDEPRMPALLVAHGRPGFYLRVLEEGVVQAGDDVVHIATGPEAMTVAELNALLYLAGHHDVDQLRRALRIPALSPGWQASLPRFSTRPSKVPRVAGTPASRPKVHHPRGAASARCELRPSDRDPRRRVPGARDQRRPSPAAGASRPVHRTQARHRGGLLAHRAHLFAFGIAGRCPVPDRGRRSSRTAPRASTSAQPSTSATR